MAFWLSERLYHAIDIDRIYGEAYQDCHEMMSETMTDIDQKWGWMQKEHIQYLFGRLTLDEMHPESVALVREFETLLPKKHPVAMATMEAFKADHRDAKMTSLLKEVLKRLELPSTDAEVVFVDGRKWMTVRPKFKVGEDESFCPVNVTVNNCGEATIKSCRVSFDFPDFVQLKRNNVEGTSPSIVDSRSSIWVEEQKHRVAFEVGDLALGLGRRSDTFYVRIPHDVKEIEVNWFLSCKTLKKYGKLILVNEPEFIPNTDESPSLDGAGA